jgi:hypothetical protein
VERPIPLESRSETLLGRWEKRGIQKGGPNQIAIQ